VKEGFQGAQGQKVLVEVVMSHSSKRDEAEVPPAEMDKQRKPRKRRPRPLPAGEGFDWPDPWMDDEEMDDEMDDKPRDPPTQ